MADVIRERQYVVDGRRADDIEVHERRWWQSNGLLLALLGLLALAVIAIFLYDRGRSARAPVIEPTVPRAEVPAQDVRAPVLAPPPPPADEGAPAMAPPPPPEEQNVTPPMVPVPTENDMTKEEAKNTDEQTPEQKATAEKNAAQGQTVDEKNAAQGQAVDEKNAAQGQAVDEKNAAQGQTADEKNAAQGQTADEKKAAQGQTVDEKNAAQGQTADEKRAAQGQTADEEKAAQGQMGDANKGQRMTAEKQATPTPAKPQQPGQTSPRTTATPMPKAPVATAPAAPGAAAPGAAAQKAETTADQPWATAASGNGCQRLDIYFNPQSMKLTEHENQELDRLAECLKKHPGTVVKFEGRSDGVELSNGDRLGKDRAQLIADKLEERGIKECRFVVVNAERSCTQNDFACRRQNRSVSVISDF